MESAKTFSFQNVSTDHTTAYTQIVELCEGDVSAPGALDKISRLQEQLNHIQLQLASKKQLQTKPDEKNQPPSGHQGNQGIPKSGYCAVFYIRF